MSATELSTLSKSLTPRTNPYIPITPIPEAPTGFTAQQTVFLLLNSTLEVLFGGAAGGGKSDGILRAAAQYVDIPGYSAILFRRTYRDLALPGALMSRSHQWWDRTDAHWDGTNYTWRFPSGATIAFGYLEHDGDETRYQSAEFQFVGMDETTQFSKQQYTYLFSRLRRLRGVDIPIRMRGATNPGGRGHLWVKERFNLPDGPPAGTNRAFVPSKLDDNPYLDVAEYERSLSELSELTYQQLRNGDWSAGALGGKFDPADFNVVPYTDIPHESEFAQIVRFWDLAATKKTDTAPDPDWTVGLKAGRTRFGKLTHHPDYYILDVKRIRTDAGGVEDFVRAVATTDGPAIPQWFEQERGSSGKLLINTYRTHVLPRHKVRRLWVTGSKVDRARIPSARAREGRVYMMDAAWNTPFLDELGLFDEGEHDDQVDALSGAFIALDREQTQQSHWKVRQH